MGHRGPDDEQFYDDGTLSLVFRRLSIVGGRNGRQPIFNAARDVLLACNGEIYNHAEMRGTLSPRYEFSTTSDCEPLLHGHEEWGDSVLERARGMFALALWDTRRQRLLLARDRLGIKPLYVCQLPEGLLFGSELKALLAHPQCPRDVDWPAARMDSLSLCATPAYVRGIDHLPGGAYLVADPSGNVRRESFWNIEDHFATAPFGPNPRPYVAEFERLIVDSVAEHLQGDWPVGIYLSGGTDSTLLAAIAARIRADVPCFSVVERTTLLSGDSGAAQRVAASLGLPWTPVMFDYRTLMDDIGFDLGWLEASVWMMDSPHFDLEWMLKQELTRAVRTHHPDVKVLLLGQGADEFAGGYSTRLDRAHANWGAYLADEIAPMLLEQGAMENAGLPALRASAEPRAGIGPYHDAMRRMSCQLQHHNLWHEDRTSSWHSIEARVPFLDHRIVELLASVPASLHEELFWNKRIVRECLGRLLPGHDAFRPKIGFCSTDDTRSLQIIVHNMAIAIARDFQEQYVEAADFPFDRTETTRLIQRVVGRQHGFYQESALLLSQASAAIFGRSCRTGAPGPCESSRRKESSLEILEDRRWEAVNREMRAEPAMPYSWRLHEVPRLAAGARIEFTPQADGTCCALIHGERTTAQIALQRDSWVERFLERLGHPDSRATDVQQWTTLLCVSREEFVHMLNVLFQCGFIAPPETVAVRTVTRVKRNARKPAWFHSVLKHVGSIGRGSSVGLLMLASSDTTFVDLCSEAFYRVLPLVG